MAENGNGNGTGVIKKQIEHTEEIGKLEHQKLEHDIKRVEEHHKSTQRENRSVIESIRQLVNDKFKFTVMVMVTLMAVIYGSVYNGDQSIREDMLHQLTALDKKIDNLEKTQYRDIERIKNALEKDEQMIYGNDRLLEAIVKGEVRLTGELDYDKWLLERIQANRLDRP